MNYTELYQSKLTTATEAVKHIPSNCRVVTGHAAGEPTHIVDAMVENYLQYENVEVLHLLLHRVFYSSPDKIIIPQLAITSQRYLHLYKAR